MGDKVERKSGRQSGKKKWETKWKEKVGDKVERQSGKTKWETKWETKWKDKVERKNFSYFSSHFFLCRITENPFDWQTSSVGGGESGLGAAEGEGDKFLCNQEVPTSKVRQKVNQRKKVKADTEIFRIGALLNAPRSVMVKIKREGG